MNKYIYLVLLVVAFAFGRYTVKPDVSISKTTDTKVNTQKDKDTHTQTQIITTKDKNGEEKTVTIITKDTTTKTDTIKDTVSDTSKVVTQPKLNTLNISALAGVDYKHPSGMIYGASLTKQVLGPVSLGVWGLTNSTVGVSIGLSF